MVDAAGGRGMRLSRKKSDALYDAIREPIIKMRIKASKDQQFDIDYALFELERCIWREVTRALNLAGAGE